MRSRLRYSLHRAMTQSASTFSPCEGQPGLPPIRVAGHRGERLASYGFAAVFFAGVVLRLFVVVLPGDGMRTPWGGGGDTAAYVLLAQNIASGRGYAYGGWPTAYRPPVYPMALAGLLRVFGTHALSVMRGLQFCAGLLVVYLCAAMAQRIFGKQAKRAALLIALFCPTLVFMTGEILSETIAALCTAAFFYLLVLYWQKPSWLILSGASLVAGAATLVRFNMVLFGIVLLAAIFLRKSSLSTGRGVALAILLPVLVVSPWLIRNFVVFHGALLLSTESGPTAVMGILAPQGRAVPGDSERLQNNLGWLPPNDIETNDASRNRLPSEAVLNRRAWGVAFSLWKNAGWALVPLTLRKFSYFWLSTDQLLSMESFRKVVRMGRAGGVVVYWGLLLLAIAGWFQLRSRFPAVAHLFLFYCVLATILHAPFNMNTRLRVPLIDPLLPVLASACWLGFVVARVSGENEELLNSPQRAVRNEA